MRLDQTVVIVAIFALLAFAVAGCGRGDSGSVASGKCRGLAHLAEAAQKFSTFLTASNPDPKKFVEDFHDFAVFRYLDAVGGAPDEIRGDVRVLDDAWLKYVDAVADLDPRPLDQRTLKKLDAIASLDPGDPDRKTLKKLDAIADLDLGNLKALQHPSIDFDIDEHKVMQAAQNISAWVQRMQKTKNCR